MQLFPHLLEVSQKSGFRKKKTYTRSNSCLILTDAGGVKLLKAIFTK